MSMEFRNVLCSVSATTSAVFITMGFNWNSRVLATSCRFVKQMAKRFCLFRLCLQSFVVLHVCLFLSFVEIVWDRGGLLDQPGNNGWSLWHGERSAQARLSQQLHQTNETRHVSCETLELFQILLSFIELHAGHFLRSLFETIQGRQAGPAAASALAVCYQTAVLGLRNYWHVHGVLPAIQKSSICGRLRPWELYSTCKWFRFIFHDFSCHRQL